MSTPPTMFAVFKDVTSYLGGWALLVYQVRYVPPGQVNEAFLWIAVALIGVPSLTQLWQLRAGGATGTTGSPSRPGSPPPPPPSSPSSGASEGRP